MGKEERNYSYDILKVLAIFQVITYHFYWWDLDIINGSSINFLYYFLQCTLGGHVPIFFFVNGALLMNKDFDVKRHTKKTVRLFVITSIHCVITMILMSMINDEILSLEEFIYQLKTWKNGWIQHLWFLQQLFIIYLLLLFIKPSFDHRPNAVKTFLAIFSILTIGNGTMTMIANIISIKSVGTLFSASFYNFFNNFHPFPSSRGGMLFYVIGNSSWLVED